MLTQENLSVSIQILTLAGIAWAVYNSLKKPQEKTEIKDAIFSEKLNGLEKMVVNLRDNHLHTLECKLDKHIEDNQMFILENTKSTTKMETLLEELLKKENV